MALFREGVLTPLPWRAFSAERVVDAFRVMQQSRHIGKLVVRMADVTPPIKTMSKASERMHFERDSTWLVTGGLSGFGLESARWLAQRGVGRLVLVSRRGQATPGATEAIASLQALGVKVEALACDITNREAVAALIERIQKPCPRSKAFCTLRLPMMMRSSPISMHSECRTSCAPNCLGHGICTS